MLSGCMIVAWGIAFACTCWQQVGTMPRLGYLACLAWVAWPGEVSCAAPRMILVECHVVVVAGHVATFVVVAAT